MCAATFSNSYVKWRLCYVILRFVAVPFLFLNFCPVELDGCWLQSTGGRAWRGSASIRTLPAPGSSRPTQTHSRRWSTSSPRLSSPQNSGLCIERSSDTQLTTCFPTKELNLIKGQVLCISHFQGGLVYVDPLYLWTVHCTVYHSESIPLPLCHIGCNYPIPISPSALWLHQLARHKAR